MTAATVKSAHLQKGFLFATVPNVGDVFVHQLAFGTRRRDFLGLKPGAVIYLDDIHDAPRGLRAEVAQV